MMYQTLQIILGALLLGLAASKKSHSPEQVHLSLGTDETEMVVTWASYKAVHDTVKVQFGSSITDLSHHAKAEVTHFHEELAEFYTYRALLTGLKPGHTYYYRVGSEDSGWTTTFHFKTFPAGTNWNPRLAIYGDLGYQNEHSMPHLTREIEHNAYDAIFHVGDFAYNLHSKDGERGNKFMRMIEAVAARVPYMVCPGNHEKKNNFSHYDARFSMIGDRQTPNHHAPLSRRINNHFHSFHMGPVHIIMFSTEFYYFPQFGWDQIRYQYHWLEGELKRANANRSVRPWIIVMGHRPLYCLKKGKDEEDEDAGADVECNSNTMERPIVRKGIHMYNNTHSPLEYGLEDLFFKYGVDLQFYGHEHYYGRLLPLYHNQIKSGHRSANPYDNPTGPVHIITGSAGNKQEHGHFNPHPKSWLAHHNIDYGYTRLIFKSRTHAVLEQTSEEKGGSVVDKIDIIKHDDFPKWMP